MTELGFPSFRQITGQNTSLGSRLNTIFRWWRIHIISIWILRLLYQCNIIQYVCSEGLFSKGIAHDQTYVCLSLLAQCFRRTTLRFLFCNSTLNAEQLASGLRVQDLLMGKVPCDVGVVCEFLWFIISFLMKMTILRYSILHVIDLFETVATFIRASACFADPFLPKQWPPVTGVQRVSEKPCTLYITVHGVTTSAILNKHICGLWIISTGLTILTKPDAAHETECSHVNTFVKQVV